jgi:hypothetical protein
MIQDPGNCGLMAMAIEAKWKEEWLPFCPLNETTGNIDYRTLDDLPQMVFGKMKLETDGQETIWYTCVIPKGDLREVSAPKRRRVGDR